MNAMTSTTALARRYFLVLYAKSRGAATTTTAQPVFFGAIPRTNKDDSTRKASSLSVVVEAKPERIFDEIDVDGTGVISKEQFVDALDRLKYSELLQIHKTVHANMERKLLAVERIEKGLQDLAIAHAEKRHAYSNVGMMTACEIEALFHKSSETKKGIRESVSELKGIISESKKATCPSNAYYNVGMMMAADIEALFNEAIMCEDAKESKSSKN